MTIQAVVWALDQDIDDPAAKLVLIGLANAFNEARQRCFPRIARLAKEASTSERTVQRKLRLLEEKGIIAVIPSHAENGRQQANEYVLTRFGRKGDNLTGGGCQTVTGEGDKAVTGEGDNCVAPLKVSEEVSEEALVANAPREGRTARKRATRVDDFEPDIAWAVAEGLSEPRAGLQAEMFLDHFRAASGANAVKADWPAAWRNWCRREIQSKGAGDGAASKHGRYPHGRYDDRPTERSQMRDRLAEHAERRRQEIARHEAGG